MSEKPKKLPQKPHKPNPKPAEHDDLVDGLQFILEGYSQREINAAMFIVLKMDHKRYKEARDKKGFLHKVLRSQLLSGITEAVESHFQEMVIVLAGILIEHIITSAGKAAGLEVEG